MLKIVLMKSSKRFLFCLLCMLIMHDCTHLSVHCPYIYQSFILDTSPSFNFLAKQHVFKHAHILKVSSKFTPSDETLICSMILPRNPLRIYLPICQNHKNCTSMLGSMLFGFVTACDRMVLYHDPNS